MTQLLTHPVECPLPTHMAVRPSVPDGNHRRRRCQARAATGHTRALNLALLLEIAEPPPAAA